MCSRCREDVILEAREDFSYISDANGAADGRLEAVPSCELEIDGVFLPFPFVKGDEVAECRVAE